MIDDIDRQIIVATQAGLPLTAEPYLTLATQIGIPVDDLKKRMQTMQDSGVIRRIGAIPNHYRLGYKANGMTVWDVPDDMVQELGKKVGSLAFVSHCYHRPRHLPEWSYNLFAMVHAHNKEEALSQVEMIANILGEDDRGHDVLFSTRILKKTGMRIPS